MTIGPQDIGFCLDKATEVADNYVLYCRRKGFERSVDDLRWVVGETIREKIVYKELPISGTNSPLPGLCLSVDGSHEIYLERYLDRSLHRFVLTKEIFQVLLRNDASHCLSGSIYKHLQELALNSPLLGPRQTGNAIVSELMAEISAMEFLFPYSERLLQKPNTVQPSAYQQIEEIYGVPQYYVEQYLSDEMMRIMHGHFQKSVAVAS